MAKRSYTPDQKAEALRLYPELGPAETAKLLDIPRATVARWAYNAGISSGDPATTANARSALAVRIAIKREYLRESLLDRALDLDERMDKLHYDYRGKDADRVEWETATSGDVRNYAGAIQVLVNTFRLESGEHTSSERMEHVSPRDALKTDLDELGVKRAERAVNE